MAKVSIILCVYKGEEYIGKCIDSVLNQTYRDIEFIIVDDGSPDNCPAIIDRYAENDARIKVIHKKNAGLGKARNTGLENVTGKYVTFIDQDDWIKEDCIEKLYNAAEETGADMAVCGLYRYFSENKIKEIREVDKTEVYSGREVINNCLVPIIGADEENSEDIEREMCVFRNMYRTDVVIESKAMFESEREYLSDDLFFNLRFIPYAKKAVVIPDCLYYYRANALSMTAKLSQDEYRKDEALYLLAKKIAKEEHVDEMLGNRIERMYLTKVRRTLILIVSSDMEKGKKLRYIKQILNEPIYKNVIKTYPIKNFSMAKKILAYFMRHKLVGATYLIISIHNRMERIC